MGGHCLVQVAATHPRSFKRLLLIDPVIMAPEIYAQRSLLPPGVEHPVARRRNAWASWQEMFDAFKNRSPYSLWRPQVLEDYCRYGVQPAEGGGFELACPPAIEASIYMGSIGTDIFELVERIEIPVTILRAKERPPGPRERMDFSDSPTWPKLASLFKHGRDVYLPHLTHFIPMQEPELVARYIALENPT
jgi:pimeloyl-ACP methyl ester carboxylesterase